MEENTKSLLRFTTTGSVDDGKSTLLGRLLYETNCIFEDQYASICETSKRNGKEKVDLALLLDGLAAEREQGITIDVAYRYFATKKRKFIIADTPGHEQYTRNMVTGASTAQLAIILIDARKGVLTQSRRHGFLLSLLQVPHLVVAVNKMDLVDYSQEVYDQVVQDYTDFSRKLDIQDITFIPVSALEGDNVVKRSSKTPWYEGETLLHLLENVHVTADRNLIDFRFSVQNVIRPHLNFRGFAGSIISGTIRKGDEIAVLPSGKTSRIKEIITYDGPLEEAGNGSAVVLSLEDEIDISRGDMFVKPQNLPMVNNNFDAIICWMDETPMSLTGHYILKQTSNKVKAFVSKIHYSIDVNTLHRNQDTKTFELNDIGRIEIKTAQKLFFDPYRKNQGTGSFILIDPLTNLTVAAGMIRGRARSLDDIKVPEVSTKSTNVIWQKGEIPLQDYAERSSHKPAVLWFTGLSGAGKTTVAQTLIQRLFKAGHQVVLLDGDNVRHGLCGDLGFSIEDRSENIRRVSEVANLFYKTGHIVICTFISPLIKDRMLAKNLIADGFYEVFVKCDIEICKRRDPKGLYVRAIAGEISDFTGISSPYEEPKDPEFLLETDLMSVEQSVEVIMRSLKDKGVLR
ncbi:MAG: bifunctional sulfate adenylyltransferase subunit 1/adenylylsulfate kinase [SAR324 cluster bacterium]|uniref:Multifunctional fusion protein n=1 Tax=SAR324 cluster bacterium TaxID=2024889 RepID=A0A2A4TAW5_9DELT|nr:MAG: bifunctional sulfate adenylyltransferase subunit 1/adenylylsulfate kinase [SAR324 cluster bacterium]